MKNLKLLPLIIGLVTTLNASASEQGLPESNETANHNTPNLTENTQQGNIAEQEATSEEESTESDLSDEEEARREKMLEIVLDVLNDTRDEHLQMGIPERSYDKFVDTFLKKLNRTWLQSNSKNTVADALGESTQTGRQGSRTGWKKVVGQNIYTRYCDELERMRRESVAAEHMDDETTTQNTTEAEEEEEEQSESATDAASSSTKEMKKEEEKKAE